MLKAALWALWTVFYYYSGLFYVGEYLLKPIYYFVYPLECEDCGNRYRNKVTDCPDCGSARCKELG